MSALVIIGPTVSGPLTSTAHTYQPDTSTPDAGETLPQSWRVRLWGDQDFHCHVDVTATDASIAFLTVKGRRHRAVVRALQ